MASAHVSNLARLCASIGDEVSEPTGFVPLRSLLHRFHSHLVFRPLLVEGMFAECKSSDAPPWAVLLDEETYPYSRQDLDDESEQHPLPSRMRFTVAHELVHSLAFRPEEFGIRLESFRAKNKTQHSYVEEIERETDRVTPLVLISDRAIDSALSNATAQFDANELSIMRKRLGVSRYVFVNRLRHIGQGDSRRLWPALRNLGVGVGQFNRSRQPVISRWPLFLNFDRNIIPEFLLKLYRQNYLPLEKVLSNDLRAAVTDSGASEPFTVNAGTPNSPQSSQLTVRIYLESDAFFARRNSFLFTVCVDH